MEARSEPAASEADLAAFTSVGRGTVVLILGTLVLFGASFVSRVLIAQSFSLADWGMFNLALAVTGLLSLASLLGLDQAAARSLSYERDPAVRRSIVRYSVGVAAAAAIVTSTVLYLLAGTLAALFRAPELTGIFQLLSVTVGFGLLSLMLAALFQGCEDAAPNALFNQVLNPLLFVAFVALALLFHLGFPGVLVGYVIASGASVTALLGFALLRLPERLPKVDGPLPRTPQLWPLALSFWGVGSLAFVTAFVDTLVLGVFWPASTVGVYAAAMTIARVLLVGNGALTYIYLPVAARFARDHDLERLRATYVAGTRWSLLIVTPLFLLFTFLPALSLAAVFGPGFESGGVTLQVLAAAAFLSVVVGPSNAALAGLGEARSLLGTTAVAAGANLALSFALIPFLGAVGAAIAWGVARGLYPGLGVGVLHRKYGVTFLHPALVRPLALTLAVAIPVVLVLSAFALPVWAVVPIGLGAFGLSVASLVATRSVLPGDFAVAHGIESVLHRPLPRLHRLLATSLYAAPRPEGAP